MKIQIAIAALVLVLAGCSSAPSDAPKPEPEQPVAEETVDSACDALTTAELSEALGFELPGGRPVSANVTENDLSWVADRCRWETDAQDVKLSIAKPADFPDAAIVCPVVSAKGQAGVAVEGLGDTASFAFDDFSGSTAELRVCTDDLLIDLSLETESELDSTAAQDALGTLASLVLGRL